MAPYDSKTFTTLKGKITRVSTNFNPIMKEKGLHLALSTPTGSLLVHVSPQWYADQKKFNFANGERLTVSGSIFQKKGERNIYAATIIRENGSVLKLRNPKTGKHLWFGRYR
ncbi:hypothetical protein ACQZV8_19135, partial [Magnetococcales bacterium HHB-1]